MASSVIKMISIPSPTSYSLLWTNPNPSDNFAGQKVTINNLNSYDFLLIVARGYKTGTRYRETFCMYSTRQSAMFDIANGQITLRTFTPSPTGITFGDCNYYASYGGSSSTGNDRIVPHTIYGLKLS